MVADFSSKPLQGKIFVMHCNTMLRVSPDEFNLHKQWHKEALECYDLWDGEEDNLAEL